MQDFGKILRRPHYYSTPKADGQTAVKIAGSEHAKKVMARACVERGIDVTNVELQTFVQQVRQEMAKSKAAEAETIRVTSTNERSTVRQSSPALRMLEAGRLARDLNSNEVSNQVEKFIAADRLAELTVGSEGSKYAMAIAERASAAAAIVTDSELSQIAQQAGVLEQANAIYQQSQDAEANIAAVATDAEYECVE